MALDQHGVLLKMVIIIAQHHSTGSPCWSGPSWFICLSTRLWGAAPARVALRRQGPREPGAAGTGFIDADARRALGWALSAKLVDSPWPSPDRAEGDALCAMVLGAVGDRDRRFVDISSAIKRARLWHG